MIIIAPQICEMEINSCVFVFLQQTADPEKAGVEAAVMATPVAAPVASGAPPQPEPAKEVEEDITTFREKVCHNDTYENY